MQQTERQLHLFRSRRQRGVTAPTPREFELQCAVADTLKRWHTPNWVYTHIPLGEERTVTAGARLKRAGTMPGWADLIFIPPLGHENQRPCFLELKRRGAKLSEAQAAFQLWCMLNKCPFAVAETYEAAIAILQQWGVLPTRIHVQ